MKNEVFNHRHFSIPKIIGMVIFGLVMAVIFGFVFGYFVQLLWNWLMPSIFGLKTITFWQAFGLVVLAKLLFGHHGHPGHPVHHGPHNWHMYKKWHTYHNLDESNISGGWKDWSYYEDWWKAQGKQAFEKYIEEEKNKEK